MQCTNCHGTIESVSDGFVACPSCGTVNHPSHAPATPSSLMGKAALLALTAKPVWRQSAKVRFAGLAVLVVLAGAISFVFVGKSDAPEQRSAEKYAATVENKNWDAETLKLEQAQKLAAENNYAEAEKLLGEISKEYPAYTKVLALRETIRAKQTAGQQQAAPVAAAPAKPQAIAPAPFTTTIQIKGDDTCKSTTLDALKLLSEKAPSHYSGVTKYISVIECAPKGSGMFAYENPPRFLVGDATRNAGTVWYAGSIVHDAGHSRLYNDYKAAHPGERVPDTIWTGEAAERACLDVQHDALSKIGATQSQLDYIKNAINTQYYDVPYENRWW